MLRLGLLLETAGDGGCAHGCEEVGGVWLAASGAVYGPVILGPGLFVVQSGAFSGGVVSLGPRPLGGWGEIWEW